jgi:hypothetical protein
MNNAEIIHVADNLPRQLLDLATSADALAKALATALSSYHARGIAEWTLAAKCAKDISEATITVQRFLQLLHGVRGKHGAGQANAASSKGKQSGRTERSRDRNVKGRVIRLPDVPSKKEAASKPGSETVSRHV